MTEVQREPVPRLDDGELETTLAFLNFARTSVLKKLEGLSEETARRPMLPTGTALLRLVSHLTDGERFWFGAFLCGVGEEPDWGAAESDNRPMTQIVAGYHAAIADSNAAVRNAGPETLSVGTEDGEHKSLRWILAHMTTETAPHAGHADAVRELIDGVTGR